jgi:hypothetical protein
MKLKEILSEGYLRALIYQYSKEVDKISNELEPEIKITEDEDSFYIDVKYVNYVIEDYEPDTDFMECTNVYFQDFATFKKTDELSVFLDYFNIILYEMSEHKITYHARRN